MYRCHQEIISIPAYTEVKITPEQRRYFSGESRIQELKFDRRGTRLATRGYDGSVKVWDPTDGQRLFTIAESNSPAAAMAFSPSHDQLAVAYADNTLELWDAGTSARLFSFRLEGETACGLTWSRDGRRLAAIGRREVSVWDATSGDRLGVQSTTQDVISAWWAPDSQRFILQSRTEARLSDPNGKEELGVIRAPDEPGLSLFVDPLARRWVTIDSQGIATLWQDAEHGTRLSAIHGVHWDYTRRVFFSPDAKRFCTGGEGGTARVWDAATGTELFSIPVRVYQARFDPEGKRLATMGGDNTAHVWDLEAKKELLALRGHENLIEAMAINPDGRRLATADREGMVKLWRTHLGREALPERSWLWGVSLSPDGRQIAVSPWGSREFTIWDATSGQRRLTVDTVVQLVTASAFSPDGRRLVTVGHDQTGRVWDTGTGQLLMTLIGHTRFIDRVAWSPSGEWIATVSFDGTTRVWDAHSGRAVHRLSYGNGWVIRVAFSPGADRLTLGYAGEHALRICDAKTGHLLTTWPLRAQPGGFNFSGDGKRLAVPMYNRPVLGFDSGVSGVELWDVDRGRRILALEGHSEVVMEAWVAHADQRIVTCSYELSLRQWESFPWQTEAYPGPTKEPFLDRARNYAQGYWQQRLSTEETPLALVIARPERATLWPPRDAAAEPDQLDLGGHYNALLGSSFVPFGNGAETDNNLSALPCGTVELGGVRFDIRGVIQLRQGGIELMDKAAQVVWEPCPEVLQNIAIGRKVRRLHVLQGTAGSATPGKVIAQWVWHYANHTDRPSPGIALPQVSLTDAGDGKGATSPAKDSRLDVRYGDDVQDWWFQPGEEDKDEPGPGRVVWRGSNPLATSKGYSLRLYLRTWENPRPDEVVQSLDYVSTLTESAPFLIAVTVE